MKTMKCIAVLSFFVGWLVVDAPAQLIIEGGTVKIFSGSSIVCSGNVSNSGTIINDGKLEIKGSFVNIGMYGSTANNDSMLLTDNGSVILNGGTSTLHYLLINKPGGGVTLAGSTTVADKFDFLAGTFSTDPANPYEFIAPVSATFSFAAGTEITGKIRRTNWVHGSPVVFNQSNMKVATSGGIAPASFMVNMLPNGDPTLPEREVKRSFNFGFTGGNAFTAEVTFPYNPAELNANAESNLVPWYYTSTEWNAKLSGNTINPASDYLISTGISSDILTNTEWKLADPKYTFNVTALLRGPWNGSLMNTSLNSGHVLPLAQPYNTNPFNYKGTEAVTAIPNANIVDWLLIELRKPFSGLAADADTTTIIARGAAFLLNDGRIVDLDGLTPPLLEIKKQGYSFVVVRHLNHLGVMSNAIASNASGIFSNDFSLLSNSYKVPSSPSDPVVSLAGGKYGLWAGDANKNGSVNAADISLIKSAIANSTSGYQLTDINLSNSINAADVSVAKLTIASSGTGNGVFKTTNAIKGEVKSNIPEQK